MGLVAPRLRATPLLASVPTDPRRRAKRKSLCGGASKWSHPLGGATFPGGDFGESRCGLCGGASKWSHPLGAGGERGKNRKKKINQFSFFCPDSSAPDGRHAASPAAQVVPTSRRVRMRGSVATDDGI